MSTPGRNWRNAHEAIIEAIKRPEDGNWTKALLEHIHERTGIVAVPHCYWTDGSIVDLRQVGKRVREVGAALVVDATQAIGAYPLDIAEIQPDFLVTATYKWLLGPYSLGFLYIAPQHRQGVPLEFPWTGEREVKILPNWSPIARAINQEQDVLIWEKEATLSPFP